jgi:polyhydroxybutyrate depolymerase
MMRPALGFRTEEPKVSLRFIAITAVFLQLLCGAAPAQQELTIEHQGVDRRVLVHAPSPAREGKLPLLIYLHGVRPPDWKNHSQREIDIVADRDGVLAAYPEAIGFKWNYAEPLKESQKAGDAVADDVGFIEKLIDRLVADHNGDPSRVYVLGDSRGGLMTFFMMCRLSEKIAAAGPLITGMTDAQVAACNPKRAVPLMAVAGSNDLWQPYDGIVGPNYRLLSVAETMEFWRVRHGCTGQQYRFLPHRLSEDRTRILLSEWSGCAVEGAVKLYRVNGGGHQVPGFAPGDPEWIKKAGPVNHDIETAEEFWTFAAKFRN